MRQHYETERLILKVLSERDAPVVLDYYKRNKIFLEPWEPKRTPSFYTLEHHRKGMAEEFYHMEKGKSFRLWLFKKEDSTLERTIGTIGFSNIVRGPFQSCFLGYKLDKDHINRGYMTEALVRAIDIMFKDYLLHRIEANIIPRNKPSLRLVKKLGFEHEGLGKKYLKINGVWEDHIHMVLLNGDLE